MVTHVPAPPRSGAPESSSAAINTRCGVAAGSPRWYSSHVDRDEEEAQMVREDMVRCARLIGEAKLLYSVDSDDAANERMDEAIRLLEMPSAEAARLRDYRARKKREQEEAAATATAATTAAPSSPAAATAPTTGVRTRTEDKTYTMGRADLERHWGDTKP